MPWSQVIFLLKKKNKTCQNWQKISSIKKLCNSAQLRPPNSTSIALVPSRKVLETWNKNPPLSLAVPLTVPHSLICCCHHYKNSIFFLTSHFYTAGLRNLAGTGKPTLQTAGSKLSNLRRDDPADPPRRIWLSTSSVSLVLAMLFLMCIIDS